MVKEPCVMSFDPLSAIFDLGKSAIERVWPDPIKRAQEMRKLEELRSAGDSEQLNAHVQLMMGQLSINAAEAKHKSLFVAGWRPFIGWVGGLALAYQFLLYPLMLWGWQLLVIFDYVPEGVLPPPVLDSGVLFSLVTAMLGIGAMRSHDKAKRVQTDKI
jgi:hypothetical protein